MKPNLIRFCTFGALMASWTYLAIFAKELGISDTEIGVIVAFNALALFTSSSIFGRASDKYGRRRFLLGGLALSSLAFFLQILAYDFLSLLILRSFLGFSLGIFPASLIAYAKESNQSLAKFSAFGALGWGVGTLLSGLIAFYIAVNQVFLFSAFLAFLALLIALMLKFESHQAIDVPRFPAEVVKRNLPLYLAVLVRHTGAHMIWTFWSLFLIELGADLLWVGVIQMMNSLTQFLFMYTLGGRIKYSLSIAAGLLLSSATFLTFTIASDFWQLIPTQILLGVSWALLYVGGLRYLMDKNVEKATAGGLLDSVLNLASIIGPFLGAYVVAFGGYRSTMYLASIFAFASFLLFKLFRTE
ncbi:MAG: MFS transporter [Candidatus Bathyarchaeota archaeon]|nr:MAG: MFS transporter [Candidatus Bathyarchaeota archaeon]